MVFGALNRNSFHAVYKPWTKAYKDLENNTNLLLLVSHDFQSNHHLQGYFLAHIRRKPIINSALNTVLSLRSIIHLEVTFLASTLSNAPYHLCHIYSRPALLAAHASTATIARKDGKTTH